MGKQIKRDRGQQGASLTEFVIVIPAMIAMIYGSMYLSDAGLLRLKAQEIGRYAAWAMAVRPLSDYEDFNHGKFMREASDDARAEVWDMYQDLDGTWDRPPGMRKKTMSATLKMPTMSDLRYGRVQIIPGSMNNQFADPLSWTGFALNALGIGTNTNDLFSLGFKNIGLNIDGQISSRAQVLLEPPVRTYDQRRAMNMATLGKEMGVDLKDSQRQLRGRPIIDRIAGERHYIGTMLVADPWRIPEGHSAHPAKGGDYARAVKKISDNGPKAIPGGVILSFIMSILEPSFPSGGNVFNGQQPKKPEAVVFSRPYIRDRQTSPPNHRLPNPRENAYGGVNLFKEAGGGSESGAVEFFETGALYLVNGSDGGYVDNLNDRGNNWQGCREAQKRRCPW